MAITIQKKSRTTPKVEKTDLEIVQEPSQAPQEEPRVLPLLTLREGVVFPSTENVLIFGRQHSQLALENALANGKLCVVVAQKKPDIEKPKPQHLYRVATLARIERTLQHEGETHVLLRGEKRVHIDSYDQLEPFPRVSFSPLTESLQESDEFEAELKHLSTLFRKTVQSGKTVEFFNFMKLVSGARSHELIDHVASALDLSTAAKQELLQELDANKRIKRVIALLSREQHILDIEQKISNETKKQIDDRMRENILRERMQAIQKELGEYDDEVAEIDELAERLEKAKMPEDIEKKVEKEIRRLRQMSPMHAEYSYVLSWIETMLDMPWKKVSRERTSLKKAAEILQAHHYGLEKVKERVLEQLAVMRLHELQKEPKKDTKKESKSDKAKDKKPKKTNSIPTILCFVGPPGVGKTSIGKSIAEALGRKFVKVSLGGVRDEAEIRGHRRTYVGAMPGKIMQALAQAGTKNPVFMLDEIDKLANDFRGDPSSALLETLDPEQNKEFSDHYLGVPFDLSEVMFITTANVLHSIPGPLRDRLEIVEYTGYTYDEKFAIGQKYLLKQSTLGAGLQPNQLSIDDEALRTVVQYYTREAGVRQLKRELSSIARKAARKILESDVVKVEVHAKDVETYLGPPKFLDTLTEKQDEVGLVNGLAWTSVGGEILQIEAALSNGKAGFTITGQLGDVMKESAKAAFTYVRSHAKELGIDPEIFEKTHVHVHIPEGAVPKDGPSAGLALTTVLASVYSGKKVRHDVAMTGEVTLRGRALPIGGLKEKLIAAHRAGMKLVLIPAQNEKDLVEIPKKVRKDLEIITVHTVDDVLEKILVKA